MNVIVSTTDEIPGYILKKYVGLAWGSSSRSRSAFVDVAATFKSIIGGESPHYHKLMNHARDSAIKSLVESAENQGANGVVGLRFESITVQSGTVDVVAYGTAVVLEKTGRK